MGRGEIYGMESYKRSDSFNAELSELRKKASFIRRAEGRLRNAPISKRRRVAKTEKVSTPRGSTPAEGGGLVDGEAGA